MLTDHGQLTGPAFLIVGLFLSGGVALAPVTMPPRGKMQAVEMIFVALLAGYAEVPIYFRVSDNPYAAVGIALIPIGVGLKIFRQKPYLATVCAAAGGLLLFPGLIAFTRGNVEALMLPLKSALFVGLVTWCTVMGILLAVQRLKESK